jgi:hypothetical protein
MLNSIVLDAIVLVVSVIVFVALIAFTIGCERL